MSTVRDDSFRILLGRALDDKTLRTIEAIQSATRLSDSDPLWGIIAYLYAREPDIRHVRDELQDINLKVGSIAAQPADAPNVDTAAIAMHLALEMRGLTRSVATAAAQAAADAVLRTHAARQAAPAGRFSWPRREVMRLALVVGAGLAIGGAGVGGYELGQHTAPPASVTTRP